MTGVKLETLKMELSNLVRLVYAGFNKALEIYTDDAKMQLGSVVSQDNQPLAFYTCKLLDSQTRHIIIKLELLSIIETLHEFCSFLFEYKISIFTNHKNLTFNNFHNWQSLPLEVDFQGIKHGNLLL